jgi:ATP-dependent Clp protease ATP-binding subunit ClpA
MWWLFVYTVANGGAMDVANLLKPMLGQGELRCIWIILLNVNRKYIENDLDLECRFQHCNQPSFEDMISNIRGLR